MDSVFKTYFWIIYLLLFTFTNYWVVTYDEVYLDLSRFMKWSNISTHFYLDVCFSLTSIPYSMYSSKYKMFMPAYETYFSTYPRIFILRIHAKSITYISGEKLRYREMYYMYFHIHLTWSLFTGTPCTREWMHVALDFTLESNITHIPSDAPMKLISSRTSVCIMIG